MNEMFERCKAIFMILSRHFQVYKALFYLLAWLRESENYSEIENENILWASIINAICIFADGKAFNVGNLFVITIYRVGGSAVG